MCVRVCVREVESRFTWISVRSYLTSDLSHPSPPAVRDDPGCDGDRHWRPVPAVVALHPVSGSFFPLSLDYSIFFSSIILSLIKQTCNIVQVQTACA